MSSAVPPSSSPTSTGVTNAQLSGGWWETYVIRYFVGTIAGSAILLFLNNDQNSALSGLLLPGIKNLASLDVGLVLVVAAVGLSYCYIASAPSLVLHASRAAFLGSNSRKLRKAWYASIVFVLIVLFWGMFFTNFPDKTVVSMSLLFLFLAVQVIPLTAALLNRGQISHDFYVTLTAKRANEDMANKEYLQSYRHLREHGNAFFILFFEGILGVILYGLPNTDFALICLIVWITPAALVWAHGTVLEARYAGLS
ncbi:hypothetical protein [Massilia aurea]|uniref:hypothetical protein n=1 Tax=Massilia aurea TaxID=373040 RepID=UPI0011CD8B4D|nr:hypothetical protein [Massilia aurea]